MTSDAAFLHRRKKFQSQSLLDKAQQAFDAGTKDADIIKQFGAEAKELDIDLAKQIKSFRDFRIKSTATTVSIGVGRGGTQRLPDTSGK